MAGDVVELDLRAYVLALKRRRLLVALTTAAVVAAALGWSLAEPVRYEARSRVLVAAEAQPSLFGSAQAPVVDPNRVVQTELLAFDSPRLRDEVRKRIGAAPRVGVQQVDVTDVVEVIATGATGRRAAAIANAYANAYIDLRRADSVRSVVDASQQLQAKVSDLQGQIDQSSGESQKALIDQQALFRQKLDQLQVDGALQEQGARLISDAAVPRSAIAPDPLRNGLVALVFGLVLGIGFALTAEHLDDSLRTVTDLQRAAPGLAVMGVIPEFEGVPGDAVASLTSPASPGAEAVRTLRTALAFLSLEQEIGVLQVTSPDAGEGKSSTVANLGVALARVGRRVVLVDCDLRRSRLHELLGARADVGLTSVLAGDADLPSALQPVHGMDALRLLPAGPPVVDPSEMLASVRLREVLNTLRRDGSIVLVDSPPVLPVADALITAPLADRTLVVCRAGRSRAKHLQRCLDLLDQVRAAVAGTVLNAVPGGDGYAGRYVYSGSGTRRPVPSWRGER